MVRVAFLWHMHQPSYRDPLDGTVSLPWVRLHAIKDYLGMVRILDETPTVHTTFNLVPVLVDQVEADEQLCLPSWQPPHRVGVPDLLQERLTHKNTLSPRLLH